MSHYKHCNFKSDAPRWGMTFSGYPLDILDHIRPKKTSVTAWGSHKRHSQDAQKSHVSKLYICVFKRALKYNQFYWDTEPIQQYLGPRGGKAELKNPHKQIKHEVVCKEVLFHVNRKLTLVWDCSASSSTLFLSESKFIHSSTVVKSG